MTSGGTSPTVNWNSANGRLRVSTSSKRFKENIKPLEFDVDKILALEPRTYQRNDDEDAEGNKLPITKDSAWHVGFIAEEANELGLQHWTFDDRDGNVLGFGYDSFTVAHQIVLRHQAKVIQDLEARIAKLEKKL
jgi:hypothetical protein